LVDDTLYFADHTLNLLKTIAETTRDRRDGDEAAHAQVVEELTHARQNLSAWSAAMEKANQIIVILLRFTPVCFHEPVVLDSLSKMLLCLLDLYANRGSLVSPDNLQGCRFNAINMLMSLVRITNAMTQAVAANRENQVLLDSLVENEMFPVGPIIEKLQPILHANQMFRGDMAANFDHFARAVLERARAFEAQKINLDDAPDEFIDGLTYELMKDPVRLPSGNIMDRNSLKKALLARPVDPWTTMPLQLEDCEPQPELKRRIEKWRAEKLAQKRA
jgi:ubiquitin conjugation factor E4 B